jgi:hypothetical protein
MPFLQIIREINIGILCVNFCTHRCGYAKNSVFAVCHFILGENKIPVGKEGLFARFPFLAEKFQTMNHLISNR